MAYSAIRRRGQQTRRRISGFQPRASRGRSCSATSGGCRRGLTYSVASDCIAKPREASRGSMQTHVHSGALFGIDAPLVDVEADATALIALGASRAHRHETTCGSLTVGRDDTQCRPLRDAFLMMSTSTSTSRASMPNRAPECTWVCMLPRDASRGLAMQSLATE